MITASSASYKDISSTIKISQASTLMSGPKSRFLTSSEKTSLGKHPRFNERMEGDPNGFISVLINGNCFQVNTPRDTLSESFAEDKCQSSFWTNLSATTKMEASKLPRLSLMP